MGDWDTEKLIMIFPCSYDKIWCVNLLMICITDVLDEFKTALKLKFLKKKICHIGLEWKEYD